MVLWQNGTLTAMKNNIWIGLKDFHQASILLFVSIPFGLKLWKTNDPIAAGEAFWQAGL